MGGVFSGVVYIPVYIRFCFGYITVFCRGALCGSRRVLFSCLCSKILEWFWLIILCVPRVILRAFFWCYFVVWYMVFCVCVVYVFVYSLSRTWLAPVQRCMYDTCYMSVLSHKTMQKCEKLHNKTLQATTR